MKVLIFHPVRLPPKNYGGAERVVLWLARGLKRLGVSVTVAALEGSELPEGIELLPTSVSNRSALRLLNLKLDFDLVHFMAPPEEGVMERLRIPSLLTVHGNGKVGEKYPENSVFLSQNHAARHLSSCFVYNGIDPDEYLFDPTQARNRFLFLSKTTLKVKNLAAAMQFCKSAGVGLEIAGGRRPVGLRLKALTTRGFSWLGPVNGKEKAKALARARALVFPVVWDEPFGLVVAEALMSGTPVLASPRGSLPELVPPEVGRLISVNDPEQWKEVLTGGYKDFSASVCREWAIQKFHYMKMAQEYLALYQRLIREKSLNRRP